MGELILLISIPLFFVVWFLIVKQLRKTGSGLIKANILGWLGGSLIAFVVMVIGGSMSPSAQHEDEEIIYTITQDESNGKIKRSLEVLLPNRVNEEDLRKIAKELYKDGYERTFIGYRLKGEENGIYWATTHYNPDLKVSFLGLDAKKYNEIKNTDLDVTGEVLGQWMANFIAEYKIVMHENDGQIYFKTLFDDGSGSDTLFTKKVIGNQTRYYDKKGLERKEYYLIGKDGELQFWSEESGNYYSAPKI